MKLFTTEIKILFSSVQTKIKLCIWLELKIWIRVRMKPSTDCENTLNKEQMIGICLYYAILHMYRVSQKKLHFILEGCSTPKF